MKKLIWATCVLAQAGLPTSGQADPAYTKEDVLRQFLPRSSERGICVSAASQPCPDAVAPPRDVSFDLLITFEKNSAELSASAQENLLVFAEALKDPALATRSFSIDGHTDKTGPEEYNLNLSKRRAEAVSKFLSRSGVDMRRLHVRAFGWQRPRVPDLADPNNRRVEAKPADPV